MIITIGGSIGSGKTTLAEEISERFNLKHVSAGLVMRKMAEEKDMSLLDFSKYAESNPKIDEEIDQKQKSLVKDDCVVDGRLSAYFIPADLNIWLDAPLKDRVERVMKRDNVSKKEARKDIVKREQSERKRYLAIYDINLDSMEIYDLIINNGRFSIKNTVDIVSAAVKGI
ncbi:MAG: AAA family ATPase [Candidatus Altiarchaeota archaeon]|nr:AAA family ATPase [Candidatus Altiarchaeota archaeon]